MTIEQKLSALLGPLVGGRAYPTTWPQNCEWPAIRFANVGTAYTPDACGDGGDDTADLRYQVDGADRTFDGMRALRRAILQAMATLDPPAVAEGAFDDYDAEEKRHRCVLEFIVQPSSDG